MSLRHALLGMLAQGPASGYDLLKRFDTSLAFVWPAKQSQIYGELVRLADAGLISLTDVGARNRKEYGITPVGRDELRRWLIDTEPDWTIRNEALLRVFFLWTVAPPEAAAYLGGFGEWARQRRFALEQIQAVAEWDDSDAHRWARVTLEYGLRMARAAEEWAAWATDNVAQPAAPSRVHTT